MSRPASLKRRRGAAAIEFALTAPILVLLVGGIIELSAFLSLCHVVARAARDGARVGSITLEGVSPTGDLIAAAAVAQSTAVLEAVGDGVPDGTAISAEWAQGEDGWYYVTVDITYPYVAISQILPQLEELDVQARFVMMTQQQ